MNQRERRTPQNPANPENVILWDEASSPSKAGNHPCCSQFDSRVQIGPLPETKFANMIDAHMSDARAWLERRPGHQAHTYRPRMLSVRAQAALAKAKARAEKVGVTQPGAKCQSVQRLSKMCLKL